MRHAIAHDLSLALAQKATHAACDHYRARFARFEPEIAWSDDARATVRFRAKGLTIAGRIDVGPAQVVVDVDVPFLLRPFQGKAVEIVEREFQRWIAKARAGEIA